MPADIRFSVAFLERINNEKITLSFSLSRRHTTSKTKNK